MKTEEKGLELTEEKVRRIAREETLRIIAFLAFLAIIAIWISLRLAATEKERSELEGFEVVHISEISEKPPHFQEVRLTKEEWLEKGRQLFGPDMMMWRFVCPACKNVASVGDFQQYKGQGATPDSATHVCIGRFDGHRHVDMGAGQPCNYSGYGLFDLCPVRVMDGDKEIRCFAFDEKGG